MGPQAKIAVLTFALQQIRDGYNNPATLARAAVKFVDDGVQITGSPASVGEHLVDIVRKAEERAAERRRSGK